MSLQRTPPATPNTPVGHSQSESDLNALQLSDCSFTNINRNKRPRTEQSPNNCDNDLKQEVMELLKSWKTEFYTKINEVCSKQDLLSSKLTTEIAELKIQTTKIQKSNDSIATSMEFFNKKYEEIVSGLDKLQKERQENRHCLEKLERKVQDLQLRSRSSCIEIRNMPVKDKETTDYLTETICTIGQTVGTSITLSDIRDIYRQPGKPGSTRPVVAEFHTVQTKLNMLSSVRKFNTSKKTVHEKLNSEHINIPGTRQPIFVADYLPPSSKKLFHLSREFAKQNGYSYCWSSNGNVYLRKVQGEKQILISSEKCLQDLKKNP